MITDKNGVVVKDDEIKKSTLNCSPIFQRLFVDRICNKCHKSSDTWFLDMATGLIYCAKCKNFDWSVL